MSPLEATLALQIRALKLPEPQREYRFLEGRKFAFDFCWPERKFAVEVNGEVHRIKSRFDSDLEKNALALIAGWKVLTVGSRQVKSGQAVKWLEILLK